MGIFGPPNIEELKASRNVKELIKALSYKRDYSVPTEAADALVELAAVEPLIKALKGKNTDIRYWAAEALGKIGDRRAVEPLIEVLRDKEVSIQRHAALALGEIGDKRAIEPLIGALRDVDWYVRKYAAEPLMVKVLKKSYIYLRKTAVEALVKIGLPAVEPLIAALKGEDLHVRWRAAEALGKIGDSRAVEPLIYALKDKTTSIQLEAELLGSTRTGYARAAEQLIDALKDKTANVQLAAEAIDRTQYKIVGKLIDALRDDEKKMYKAVIEALGKIGDSWAVEPLIDALKDKDSYVRRYAAGTLGKIGWKPDISEPSGAFYLIAKKDWDKCAEIGAPAVKPLIDALKDKIANVQLAAAEALKFIGGQGTGGWAGTNGSSRGIEKRKTTDRSFKVNRKVAQSTPF